ncbi:MAG: hypothetical protein QM691_07575 [Opitutaceae bacterium]
MSIFKSLFGKKEPAKKPASQAVIVHIPLSDGANGSPEEFEHLTALEEKLGEAIIEAGAGEFDGNEFGQGDFTYFMYGSDADQLFSAVEPILRGDALTKKGYALVRYGGPGSDQRRVELSA